MTMISWIWQGRHKQYKKKYINLTSSKLYIKKLSRVKRAHRMGENIFQSYTVYGKWLICIEKIPETQQQRDNPF
jgi:hypothetical protein